MNPFMPHAIAAMALCLAWSVLLLSAPGPRRQWPALAGGWAGALVLAALWRADSVPWLWIALKALVLFWLGALTLMIIGAIAQWRRERPGRFFLAGCAILSICINVVAGLHFLWLAVVSPGGV